MERFKKALDRARSERARHAKTISPDTVRSEEIALSNTADSVHPQDIVYSQTRAIKISEKAMKKNRLIGGTGVGAEMDSYRMLRTNLMHILRANNWKTLAITSTRPGEGKTLTAINLAISMAMDVNHTVLLVDMDLRKPSIHHYLNYKHKKGLSEFITEDIALEKLLITLAEIPRLVILPGNKAFTHSSEIMSLPKMVKMIEEIKARCSDRYIIFDLPPMLSTDDALVFSQHADAYLLVIEDGKTQQDDLRRVKEIMRPINIIGTILNKSTEVSKNYYYR